MTLGKKSRNQTEKSPLNLESCSCSLMRLSLTTAVPWTPEPGHSRLHLLLRLQQLVAAADKDGAAAGVWSVWRSLESQRISGSPATTPLSFFLLSEQDLFFFEQLALDTSSVFFMWCNQRQQSHIMRWLFYYFSFFFQQKAEKNEQNKPSALTSVTQLLSVWTFYSN